LLNELRPRQVKPKPLICTVDNKCWCMKVKTKLLHSNAQEGCMSPAQMLEQTVVELPKEDRDYLKSLLSREFISP
jgi:hypothetical protein